MKRILFIALILIMAATTGLGVCAAQEKKEVLIYSARFGGITYMAGLTMSELLNKKHPWLRATNMETSGSIGNIKQYAKSPEDRAKSVLLISTYVYWSARNGQEPFTEKYGNLKLIYPYAISLSGLFATANPDIKTAQDFVGKRIGVGERGSGFMMETKFSLQDCWGIWDKIKPEYLGFKSAHDAFMDGLIDVTYSPGNWGGENRYEVHPLMKTALRLKKGVHFIGPSPQDMERGVKATGWPISAMTLPAGAFEKGIPDRDIMVYPVQLMACAYEDLDNEIVYEMVKSAHQNIQSFGEAHASMKVMTPKLLGWLPATSEADIHPGALKYFKEQGIPISMGGKVPDL